MPQNLLPILTKPGNVEFARRLQQNRASFVIIGGIAVAAHSCRDFMDVDDLDIMIAPYIENAQRVASALGASNVNLECAISDLAKPAKLIHVRMWHYYFDLITPKPDIDFAGLRERAVCTSMDGMRVPVVGRADLIALKEEAVSQPDCDPKHQRDLECLRAMTRRWTC
jgi:predicted nucleotidyltransferase